MMRVTSQMLDKAAAKSGLPIRRASLLDYIDNPSLGNNPLLNVLLVMGRNQPLLRQRKAEMPDKYMMESVIF